MWSVWVLHGVIVHVEPIDATLIEEAGLVTSQVFFLKGWDLVYAFLHPSAKCNPVWKISSVELLPKFHIVRVQAERCAPRSFRKHPLSAQFLSDLKK